MPVLDRAGNGSAGLPGDEPGQGPAELAGEQPERLAVDGRYAVATVMRAAVVTDPAGELVDLPAGGTGAQRRVCAAAGRAGCGTVRQDGEQQVFRLGLQFLQDRDRPGDGLADDPGGRHSGRVPFSFECQAGELPPVGAAISVADHLQAAAAQVLDYWWRGVIRSVRYSLLRKRRAAASVSSIFWWSRDDRGLVTLRTAATRPSPHG